MTATPSPLVRSMIVCEDIIADPRNPNRISLVNLVHSIRSLATPPYPLQHARLCLFMQLTEGRGTGKVRVAIQDAETEAIIFQTRPRAVSFSGDPLAVYGCKFRFRRITFPKRGLYWIQFWYDNDMLAQLPIILR